MDFKLELVTIPVSDVDRAKAFYEQAGFVLDHDHAVNDDLRFVQLTPPGSACSIALGTGLSDAPVGSARAQVVVDDAEAACAELRARGVDASDVQVFPWGRSPSSPIPTATAGRFNSFRRASPQRSRPHRRAPRRRLRAAGASGARRAARRPAARSRRGRASRAPTPARAARGRSRARTARSPTRRRHRRQPRRAAKRAGRAEPTGRAGAATTRNASDPTRAPNRVDSASPCRDPSPRK